MTKPLRLLLVGLAATTLWATPVLADPDEHPAASEMGRRGPGMFAVFLKAANLTADQESRVTEIMAAHRAKSRSSIKQLRAAQAELTDRLLAPGPLQADDLKPYRERLAQLWEQMSQDRLAVALEIRAVLTPDQLAKVAHTKDRFRALRSEMHGLFQGK